MVPAVAARTPGRSLRTGHAVAQTDLHARDRLSGIAVANTDGVAARLITAALAVIRRSVLAHRTADEGVFVDESHTNVQDPSTRLTE